MGKMKLSDIKIRESFLNSTPSQVKYQKKKEKWLRNGRQDRYIVVNRDGYLEDGYITYLIMKELGFENVKVIKSSPWTSHVGNRKIKEPAYRTENTTYISGVHPGSSDKKVYTWRVPNDVSWDEFKENISVGDMIFCSAKGKKAPVIIKEIQTTDICPTPLNVKKVCSKRIVKGGEDNARYNDVYESRMSEEKRVLSAHS